MSTEKEEFKEPATLKDDSEACASGEKENDKTEEKEAKEVTLAMSRVGDMDPFALITTFVKIAQINSEKAGQLSDCFKCLKNSGWTVDKSFEEWQQIETYVKTYIYTWVLNRDTDIKMLIDSMTDKKKSKSGGKLGSKKPRNPDESSGDDSLLLSMTEDTESSEHEEEKTSKKRRKTEPAGRSKKDKTDKKRKREPSPNSTNKKPRTNGESELYEKIVKKLNTGDSKKYTGTNPLDMARKNVLDNPKLAKMCHFCKAVRTKLFCTTEGCPDKKVVGSHKPSIRKYALDKEQKLKFSEFVENCDREDLRNSSSYEVTCKFSLSKGSKCGGCQILKVDQDHYPFMKMIPQHNPKCPFSEAI